MTNHCLECGGIEFGRHYHEAPEQTYEEWQDEHDIDEPCEGDYTITPSGPLGSRSSVGQVEGKHLGEFPNDDSAREFIRERMDKEQYWPNVWLVSDHGNWNLTQV